MKIRLSEIPPEGRDYDFTRGSGELNASLEDLLGAAAPYRVHITIRPAAGVHEISGFVEAQAPELCSKCGWDLQAPVRKQFREFTFDRQEEDRTAKSVRGNQSRDFVSDEPEMIEITNGIFDLSDFVYETFALAIPDYIDCGDAKCPHLAEMLRKKAELDLEFERSEKQGPFSVLKTVEIPKKNSGKG